jgi:hypothetical protein
MRWSFLALLLSLCALPSRAGTLLLDDPSLVLCVTDPGAVYGVQEGALRPVQGLFSFFRPGERPLQTRIVAPEEGQPGDLLSIFVSSPEPLRSVSLSLEGPGNRELSRATGFPAFTEGSRVTWAVLVGVPAGAAVRGYSLWLRVVAGSRSCLLIKPLLLHHRAFSSERINLTKELTTLVTDPDPRKVSESRTLARILATPHSDAVFETGALAVPLPGARRTSGYGDRREYVYSDASRDLSIHEGVDIASPTGTPVSACGRGRVVFVGARILSGNTVVIEHLPGLFSIYYHLSEIQVMEGELVEKSQAIGQVGMTGFATGPHLHWEVQSLGVAVDPDRLTQRPLLDTDAPFNDIEGRNSTEGR